MQNTRPKYVFFRPTGELLLTLNDAKQISPLVELDMPESSLNDLGFFRMEPTPIPECGQYQFVQEVLPVYAEGKYQRRYEVVDMFPADIVGRRDRIVTIAEQIEAYEQMRCTRLRQELRSEALALHENSLSEGFQITYEGVEYRVKLDPMTYMELVAASHSEEELVSIPADQELLLTPAQALIILKQVSAKVQECTTRKMHRLKKINEAATFAELQTLKS